MFVNNDAVVFSCVVICRRSVVQMRRYSKLLKNKNDAVSKNDAVTTHATNIASL